MSFVSLSIIKSHPSGFIRCSCSTFIQCSCSIFIRCLRGIFIRCSCSIFIRCLCGILISIVAVASNHKNSVKLTQHTIEASLKALPLKLKVKPTPVKCDFGYTLKGAIAMHGIPDIAKTGIESID